MQGFNMGRYYPPDETNPPTFNNSSHPLGKRANKISQGVLIVRFELPFAVWCNHCKPQAIVGQGVRFNAEKKKVGTYYSTPIWSFRMKHSACGGWWEIKTDPKSSEYIAVDGAKRRDYGPGEASLVTDGDLKFLTEEEREKRRTDAFANLEGKLEDQGTERTNKLRIEELYDQSEVWKDPDEANAKLRRGFREKRRQLYLEKREKQTIQDKFSLGIDIVEETQADRMRAAVVEYGNQSSDGPATGTSTWTPIFNDNIPKEMPGSFVSWNGRLKPELVAEQGRRKLQTALVNNSKSALDPFVSKDNAAKTKPSFGILKRKRCEDKMSSRHPDEIKAEAPSLLPAQMTKSAQNIPLVTYDSD